MRQAGRRLAALTAATAAVLVTAPMAQAVESELPALPGTPAPPADPAEQRPTPRQLAGFGAALVPSFGGAVGHVPASLGPAAMFLPVRTLSTRVYVPSRTGRLRFGFGCAAPCTVKIAGVMRMRMPSTTTRRRTRSGVRTRVRRGPLRTRRLAQQTLSMRAGASGTVDLRVSLAKRRVLARAARSTLTLTVVVVDGTGRIAWRTTTTPFRLAATRPKKASTAPRKPAAKKSSGAPTRR